MIGLYKEQGVLDLVVSVGEIVCNVSQHAIRRRIIRTGETGNVRERTDRSFRVPRRFAQGRVRLIQFVDYLETVQIIHDWHRSNQKSSRHEL